MQNDIEIRIEGKAGRLTLNRPKALNALSYEMVLAIEHALLKWRDNDAVNLVIIDGAGDKAFCAGGDIQKLYNTGITGKYGFMRRFWADEYRLNAMIANYPKPYIALMDGIVMGGGVGVSAHGSHRIVTERTVLAMPECAIGLVPDVGGSKLLANAPGHLGEWMGITGARMNATDAIYARFADRFVPTARIPALITQLTETGSVAEIENFCADFSNQPSMGDTQTNIPLIEQFFSGESAADALCLLDADKSDWAIKQAKAIRRACPLSAACTWQLVRNARKLDSIEAALNHEYRFVWRSMDEGDVLEGVRALIIDKDRNPQWKVKQLELISDDMVSTMLAPLGENELNLRS